MIKKYIKRKNNNNSRMTIIVTVKNNYKKDLSNSKWKIYFDNLYANELYPKEIEQIVIEFQRQLLLDEQNMNEQKMISDCCIFAPRKSSHLQKKYNLSRMISNDIFKEISNPVHSSIHYHRLIAKLSRYHHQQTSVREVSLVL